MAWKRTRVQRIGDWLSDRLLRGLIGLALALPYGARVRFMGWLMRRIVGPLAGYCRAARENLAFIWPGRPATERARIARAVCDNAGRTLIENYSTGDFLARMAEAPVSGAGLPALAEARRTRRPVLLVTGHFGNYEAARAALVARGYRIGGLYRPMKNAYFNAHYVATMEAFGGPVVPQGRAGTRDFVRSLRGGGMMVLLHDQFVRKGISVDFLGQPARTTTSPAELALRYEALLLPFYATRRDDGLSFDIEIEAPVAHTDVEQMTRALSESLAARIEAHPEQWFWVHRRWKQKPQRRRAAASIGP